MGENVTTYSLRFNASAGNISQTIAEIRRNMAILAGSAKEEFTSAEAAVASFDSMINKAANATRRGTGAKYIEQIKSLQSIMSTMRFNPEFRLMAEQSDRSVKRQSPINEEIRNLRQERRDLLSQMRSDPEILRLRQEISDLTQERKTTPRDRKGIITNAIENKRADLNEQLGKYNASKASIDNKLADAEQRLTTVGDRHNEMLKQRIQLLNQLNKAATIQSDNEIRVRIETARRQNMKDSEFRQSMLPHADILYKPGFLQGIPDETLQKMQSVLTARMFSTVGQPVNTRIGTRLYQIEQEANRRKTIADVTEQMSRDEQRAAARDRFIETGNNLKRFHDNQIYQSRVAASDFSARSRFESAKDVERVKISEDQKQAREQLQAKRLMSDARHEMAQQEREQLRAKNAMSVYREYKQTEKYDEAQRLHDTRMKYDESYRSRVHQNAVDSDMEYLRSQGIDIQKQSIFNQSTMPRNLSAIDIKRQIDSTTRALQTIDAKINSYDALKGNDPIDISRSTRTYGDQQLQRIESRKKVQDRLNDLKNEARYREQLLRRDPETRQNRMLFIGSQLAYGFDDAAQQLAYLGNTPQGWGAALRGMGNNLTALPMAMGMKPGPMIGATVATTVAVSGLTALTRMGDSARKAATDLSMVEKHLDDIKEKASKDIPLKMTIRYGDSEAIRGMSRHEDATIEELLPAKDSFKGHTSAFANLEKLAKAKADKSKADNYYYKFNPYYWLYDTPEQLQELEYKTKKEAYRDEWNKTEQKIQEAKERRTKLNQAERYRTVQEDAIDKYKAEFERRASDFRNDLSIRKMNDPTFVPDENQLYTLFSSRFGGFSAPTNITEDQRRHLNKFAREKVKSSITDVASENVVEREKLRLDTIEETKKAKLMLLELKGQYDPQAKIAADYEHTINNINDMKLLSPRDKSSLLEQARISQEKAFEGQSKPFTYNPTHAFEAGTVKDAELRAALTYGGKSIAQQLDDLVSATNKVKDAVVANKPKPSKKVTV